MQDLQENLEKLQKEKLQLLELLNTYKTKLEVERNEHDKCRQQYRLERQKTVKLEGAAATSELEALMTVQSTKTTKLSHKLAQYFCRIGPDIATRHKDA